MSIFLEINFFFKISFHNLSPKNHTEFVKMTIIQGSIEDEEIMKFLITFVKYCFSMAK